MWADLTLSAPTLVAGSTGIDQAIPAPALVADIVRFTEILPAPALSAAGSHEPYSISDLPAAEVSAQLSRGYDLSAALPPAEVSTLLFVGTAAGADVGLPAYGLTATGGADADAGLPAYELSAGGVSGAVANADNQLLAAALAAAGAQSALSEAAITLPSPRLSALVATGPVLSVSAGLPPVTLLASGTRGTDAVGEIFFPAPTLSALGHLSSRADAAPELPLLYLSATGHPTPADHWRTWVLNLRRAALTEYTGHRATGFAKFAGRVLMSSPDGIRELTEGDTDAGTPIAAEIKTGVHDFNTARVKRVPRLYVSARTSGDLEFLTHVDGVERKYLLRAVPGSDSLQQRRVPVGRGPKAAHWQFSVRNRAGADFELDAVLAYPELLDRKVR